MAATSSSSEQPVASANKLPAVGLLSSDTTLAAQGSTAEGMSYIGVWAKDAAGCASIDQAGAADFAVITVSTVRTGASACYGNNAAMTDGKATLNVGCPGSGTNESYAISMPSPETLQLNNGPALVRCEP